jgi:RNA polymerase sigma-70 factor (ECF subfamily)
VPHTDPASAAHDASRFEATRWSIVVAAGGADSERAHKALEYLCAAYWYPLYAYVRRQGRSPHDAQDLTQAFFARLLARNFLGDADPAKGRFRSFLLGALKHFLSDAWDRERAQKRGGGVTFIPLDAESAETRYKLEPADESADEHLYDRRWALALLDEVLRRIRSEYARDGREPVFDALKPSLTGAKIPHAEIAARLGVKEGAIRTAIHRLRTRYRDLLRAEIAGTVASPAEVDAEMQHLFAALAG